MNSRGGFVEVDVVGDSQLEWLPAKDAVKLNGLDGGVEEGVVAVGGHGSVEIVESIGNVLQEFVQPGCDEWERWQTQLDFGRDSALVEIGRDVRRQGCRCVASDQDVGGVVLFGCHRPQEGEVGVHLRFGWACCGMDVRRVVAHFVRNAMAEGGEVDGKESFMVLSVSCCFMCEGNGFGSKLIDVGVRESRKERRARHGIGP